MNVNDFLNAALKSWKTSLTAIPGGAVLFIELNNYLDGDPSTLVDLPKLLLGAGLVVLSLLARDNNISSESAGAK